MAAGRELPRHLRTQPAARTGDQDRLRHPPSLAHAPDQTAARARLIFRRPTPSSSHGVANIAMLYYVMKKMIKRIIV